MEVAVGTYNHVLFGFNLVTESDKGKEIWQFNPVFTDQGHAGCIKSVASGGRYLASGSTDESIRLFDMKKHVELGTLIQQSGTISCMVFCGSSHMLSGSDDGTICIWKCKTWECEKTLKGHRGAVNSISMHPSGRLALSVSKDKTIKTWNLLTGRAAYTTNLKEVGELVRWSPKGDCYAIVVGCKITFYKIGGIDEPCVYTCEKYILAVEFLTDSVVVLAGDSDDVIIYNVQKDVVLQRIGAHKIRTKAVSVTSHPHRENMLLLFTVASDGNLKVWSLNKENLEEAPTLLAGINMPGRPTCMTLKLPAAKKNIKETENNNKVEQEVEDETEEKVTTKKNKNTTDEDLVPHQKKVRKKKKSVGE